MKLISQKIKVLLLYYECMLKKREPTFLKARFSLTLIEIGETFMSQKTVKVFNCF